MNDSRDTKPGFLFKLYGKAKAAVGDLKGKGKDAARNAAPSAGADDDGKAASERPAAGEDWKTTPSSSSSSPDAPSDPTTPSDKGPGSGDAQKRRGDVELESPSTTRPGGGEENPASPAGSDIDRPALHDMQSDEVGQRPKEGLGLDDGPKVKYPTDTGE